jgi:hypothetical protein
MKGGYQSLGEANFERYEVAWYETFYGVFLAAVVTTAVSIQAFAAEDSRIGAEYAPTEYNVAEDVRYIVFAAHVATLVFVLGDLYLFHGKKGFYSHLTIGSGVLATLGQVALVPLAANETAFVMAITTLAVQSYANALMLAFIIADLKLR